MSQRRLVSLSHKITHLAKRLAQTFSKQFLTQLLRTAAPILVALSFAGISRVAHAQGTMDFSGATTLMATFKTHEQAELAIKDLQEAGVDMKSLSIAAKDSHTDEHVVGYYNAGDRMKYWGKMGAFWGGFWGLLFGSAIFAIPGSWPVQLRDSGGQCDQVRRCPQER